MPLLEGTLITLKNGITKKVEDLKINDELITYEIHGLENIQNMEILQKKELSSFSGSFQESKIKNIWLDLAKKIYKVNDSLLLDGSHYVYIKRNDKYYWSEIQYCLENYYGKLGKCKKSIQVNDQLLEFAKSDVQKAIDILTFMGYSNQARIGRNNNPGMWMTESTRRLMQKSKEGVIYNDLLACSNFENGLEKAKKVSSKVQLILGSNDFLTPTRKASDLIENFKDPDVKIIKDSGHTLMTENPNQVLDYLIEAL